MPVSGDDFVCPKFQPNIFDSSRCHDCLRQKHLHSGTGATPQLSPAADPETAPGTTGPPPPQLPGQAEERDTSTKEDSDGLSVVSSYCDVSRGRRGYEESSLCILSPGCELYICDGDDDDSTDSCRDQSDYAEFSGSISAEDDYLPLQRLPVHRSMTWLDPPPHRPNPRAWMDEARSRDSFGGGRHSGFKGERDRDSGMRGERDRESGYFSLGRAGGARSLRDKSPPPLHRHYERGHPLYSNRSPEPKATIPFRNPNLGLASERQNPEILNQDLPPESLPPPDLYDIAVEVEAQVGPRSPSPTPFKIAESLASSTNRRGFNSSYSRGGNSSSHSSSYQQSGHFNTSRQGSTLQSRSSSPSRGTSPFKRSESTASLNRRGGFDGGGGRDQRPRSPSQSSYGRGLNSGSLPKNFKSVSSSVKTQSNTFTDFKSSLRKTEVNGSLNGRGRDSRTSSPLKSGYDTPSQTLLRKSDFTNGSLNGRSHESRNSSPSSRGRSYDTPRPSQTLLRKSESSTSLSSRGHGGRSGSPIRQGYDIESLALLRNAESRNDLNDYEHESFNSSPPRRGFDTPSQSVLRKSEPNSYGSSRDSRSSSPSKKGYEAPSQTMLRKTEVSSSLNGRGRDSRTSSPSRRGYETPSQSQLRKTETNSSVRGHSSHDSLSPSPSRRGYDAPSQSLLRKSETNNSVRSHRHSHDSRGSSPSRSRDDTSSQSQLHKTETRGSLSSRTLDSRSSSPSRRGNNPPGQSALRKTTSGDATGDGLSYHRKSTYSDTRPESNPSPGSWRGSSPSLHITSSPSRQGRESSRTQTLSQKSSVVTMETHRGSSSRRGFETRSSSPDPPANRSSNHRNRSPSPNIRTSSQSSMESSESGQLSGGSVGRNREEYAMLADLPKVKPVLQREGPGHVGKTQNCPSIRQALFKPASHSLSKHPSREWDDSGDLERDHIGWHNGSSGRLSRAHSSTSLHVQRSRSPTIEEASPTSWRQQHRSSREQMQPDLLNFKKGWMSKLDEIGEWKKHWFVLTDAGLRYYRDSGAEEKDDLDGEIDLKSCVKVSEFDVEKNYGFQIQTREAVVTLSAMTAGIRRNWIEVLRKSVRPSSSPDLTQLPDSSSDKENTHSRSLTSSRRPSSRHSDTRLEVPTSTTALRKVDYVELSPVPAPSSPMLATQREAGEGQGREHAQWQDEKRTRDATSSQWEAVLSRKGPGSDPRRMEEEIERKWAEFERLPLKEMRSLTSTGSRSSQPANEALQREVASLRQQLECLQGGGGGGRVGGGGGGGGCGPLASCGRSLEAMERAHRQAMDEVQKQHARETRELERDRDRLLREETQATAQVMETLKKAHKEELEREVEKAKRLSGGGVDTHTLRAQQQAETQALQRELSGLSERYSQKCLDLNRAEKSNGERERDVSRKEKEMEQLRKENKDLQARLTEEISRMRSLMTGQGSESVSNDNRDRTSSELEVLLRVKENEVQYLHKEISCLRNELQFLNTEKRTACDRYKEVHEELSGMKSRSEREIHSLKEHLKLAMAALQEGQKLGNSLEH